MKPTSATPCRMTLLSSTLALLFVPVEGMPAATPRTPGGGQLHLVTNCDDSGPGSLRDTVASAISGDSIDLGPMGCSTLTLTTGAILVAQDELTIKYSTTTGRPTITSGYRDRIFNHTGHGTLEIDHLVLAEGKYSADGRASGGCVYSNAGEVKLQASVITQCTALSEHERAYGGGVSARTLAVYDSVIMSNHAKSNDKYARGGGLSGIYGTISGSSIVDNDATATAYGCGGGVAMTADSGTAAVDHTLIAFNSASHCAGGLAASGHDASSAASITIVDTTVYANIAGDGAGGLDFDEFTGEIHNSTIVGNRVLPTQFFDEFAAGLGVVYTSVSLSSSIVSGNATAGYPDDGQIAALHGYFSGDHDLVFGPAGVDLPADTLTSDPKVFPLADNGGVTQTLAIAVDSPAIDHGIASDSVFTDQRDGAFSRLVGLAVDIGAFERQGPGDGDYISIGSFDPANGGSGMDQAPAVGDGTKARPRGSAISTHRASRR